MTASNVSLRPAAGADQAFIDALYFSTRDDLRALPMDAEMIAGLISMQQRAQSAGYRNAYPDAQYCIIEQAAVAVGQVVVDLGASELRLVDISVLPQAQGRGVAGSVLRQLQRRAADAGLPMALNVFKGNQRARNLYIGLGFAVVSADAVSEQLSWTGTTSAAK